MIKDKVFFFGDYQGYRQTNGQLVPVTVPTLAELRGFLRDLGTDL